MVNISIYASLTWYILYLQATVHIHCRYTVVDLLQHRTAVIVKTVNGQSVLFQCSSWQH